MTLAGLELPAVALLLAWGTVAAVDLVSFPQCLLARPIVACGVAGALAGDVGSGLRVGALLELFALEALPVGAARYPDHGPGAVAAAVAAAGLPAAACGPAVLLGVAMGAAAGRTLPWLRRANARAMERRLAREGVTAGGLAALQAGGLARDALRGLVLTALGIGAAALLRTVAWPDGVEGGLLAVAVGGGAAAAGGSALRATARDARGRWLAAGAAGGLALALWRVA